MQLLPSPYGEDRLVVNSDWLLDHSIAHLAKGLQVAVGELWILLMARLGPLAGGHHAEHRGPQPGSALGLGLGMQYLLS